MITLEAYLKAAEQRGVIDHCLRAHTEPDGTMVFYIHPHNLVYGDTLDFIVKGNGLTTKVNFFAHAPKG